MKKKQNESTNTLQSVKAVQWLLLTSEGKFGAVVRGNLA